MNKKKYLLIGIGALLLIGLISTIGEDSKEYTPQPEKTIEANETHIKGHLGDCFELVTKTYKIRHEYSDKILAEVKRTEGESKLLNKHINNLTTNSDAGGCFVDFVIEYLDADGDVVNKRSAISGSEVISAIKNTRLGETATIEFYVPDNCSPVAFRLSSVCEYKAPKEEQKTKKSESGIFEDEIFDDEDLEEDIEKLLCPSRGSTLESLLAIECQRVQRYGRSTDIRIDRAPFIMENEIHPFAVQANLSAKRQFHRLPVCFTHPLGRILPGQCS